MRGRYGDILLGVGSETMNVLASSKEDYIILLHIRNKAENF
jgi:hypothetical protein